MKSATAMICAYEYKVTEDGDGESRVTVTSQTYPGKVHSLEDIARGNILYCGGGSPDSCINCDCFGLEDCYMKWLSEKDERNELDELINQKYWKWLLESENLTADMGEAARR